MATLYIPPVTGFAQDQPSDYLQLGHGDSRAIWTFTEISRTLLESSPEQKRMQVSDAILNFLITLKVNELYDFHDYILFN